MVSIVASLPPIPGTAQEFESQMLYMQLEAAISPQRPSQLTTSREPKCSAPTQKKDRLTTSYYSHVILLRGSSNDAIYCSS